jgi:hypothetical protein
VARGSTLLNILQQIAGSIGSATMSVILTNELNDSPTVPGPADPPVTEAGLAIAVQQNPAVAQQFPVDPSVLQRGLAFVADSFATTFWVGFVLVLLTLIPAFFLQRRRLETPHADAGQEAPPPMVVH